MARRRNETATTKAKLQELRPQKTLIATAQLNLERGTPHSTARSHIHASLAVKTRVYINLNKILLSFPGPSPMSMLVHVCPPFPLQTPGLTRKARLRLSITSVHHPTSAHPTLSLLYSFPAFLPTDAPIQNSSAFVQPI